VDDGSAIHGNGGHEPALHQLDEHRADSGLDDVRAHSPENSTLRPLGLDQCPNNLLEIDRGENIRQGIHEHAQGASGLDRTREVRDLRFTVTRIQRIRFDIRQIELVVRELRHDIPPITVQESARQKRVTAQSPKPKARRPALAVVR
jgi:hypothetical protein